MNKAKRLANAIRKSRGQKGFVYGFYQAAESADADLSQVLVPGAGIDGQDDTHRFVPKGSHVTGLTSGDLVLLAGNPLCIIARVLGDISLAEM